MFDIWIFLNCFENDSSQFPNISWPLVSIQLFQRILVNFAPQSPLDLTFGLSNKFFCQEADIFSAISERWQENGSAQTQPIQQVSSEAFASGYFTFNIYIRR